MFRWQNEETYGFLMAQVLRQILSKLDDLNKVLQADRSGRRERDEFTKTDATGAYRITMFTLYFV
ncbi:hypothetical protein CRPA23_23120 [Pseudomonas aeruginosa]